MRGWTGRIGILSVVLSLMAAAPAAGQDVACVVSDPTGTPLTA
ncbi:MULTISPECIES: hypothetical protein [Ensifer]|jgi:hypothetical protein|nr:MULTISPECIES: hypothetical protein [Ensifer]MDP9628878.1 hypothetical protein [Ensifer adhaerens]